MTGLALEKNPMEMYFVYVNKKRIHVETLEKRSTEKFTQMLDI